MSCYERKIKEKVRDPEMDNYYIPADKESKPCNATELSPENHTSITRPDSQPIATVVPETANDDDRYSRGSHRIFRQLYVTHMLSLLKLYSTGLSRRIEWSNTMEAAISIEGTVGRTSNVQTSACK